MEFFFDLVHQIKKLNSGIFFFKLKSLLFKFLFGSNDIILLCELKSLIDLADTPLFEPISKIIFFIFYIF